MTTTTFGVAAGAPPIRGAIKTSISTSTESLVAGQEFSIFVTIQNPFEIPLTIRRISTYLPTELLDVDQALRGKNAIEIQEQIAEIKKVGTQEKGYAPRLRQWFENAFNIFFLVFAQYWGLGFLVRSAASGPAVARDVAGGMTLDLNLLRLDRVARIARQKPKDPDAQAEEFKVWRRQVEQELQQYENALSRLQNPAPSDRLLQAGNSTTRVFTVCSKGTVWFKPASYRLQIEVEYEIGGVQNVDTIEHMLQVKSSLAAIVLGALVGGLGGWFTSKGATARMGAADALNLAINLVFATMAVVLFARKKDVQPLISVEDFWGGVAIGFLVAYSGPKVFSDLFSASTGAPAAAAK